HSRGHVRVAPGRRVRALRRRPLPGARPGAAAVVAVGVRRPPPPPGPRHGDGDHPALAGGGPARRLARRRRPAAPPVNRGLTPNGGRCRFVAVRGNRGTVPACAGTVPTPGRGEDRPGGLRRRGWASSGGTAGRRCWRGGPA